MAARDIRDPGEREERVMCLRPGVVEHHPDRVASAMRKSEVRPVHRIPEQRMTELMSNYPGIVRDAYRRASSGAAKEKTS